MRLILIISGIFVFMWFNAKSLATYMEKKEMVTIYVDFYKKYKQNLEKAGFRFVEVVIAQTVHESDEFKSKIFTECNNPFGMKFNSRGIAVGKCREHAKYKSLKDAFRDYRQYQEIWLKYYEKHILRRACLTNKDYLKFLDRMNYAEDRKYCEKLEAWMAIIDETELLIPLTETSETF